ncbi:MAG TPA: lysophospholipid acyltransferase family protein [Syntrophobacteria bacterium]|nr:lysophospholipid acyltransferase family protein [Syntrophobacteria bacterium]
MGCGGVSRFLQWRPNTFLVRWMPFVLSRAYLGLLGRIYYQLERQEGAAIRENLDAAARKVPLAAPLGDVVHPTFLGIYTHYFEKLITAYAPVKKVYRLVEQRTTLQDERLLQEALALGRGVIFVSAHFGGIEFLPVLMALKGYPVAMVLRFKTSRLKQALTPRAEALNIRLIDAGNGDGVLFAALDSLKENRILITACDEFKAWRPAPKRSAEFLGCSCPMDRTLDILHRRYRSPTLMGLNRRMQGARFQLIIHDLTAQKVGLGRESLQQKALRILEQYICEAPDQWYQWRNVRVALGRALFENVSTSAAVASEPALLAVES